MTRSGTLRVRLRRKLIAAFAAMVLALIGLGATAPAASAGTTYGLGACAWMNYKVKYGSTGDCVEAVQSFLRYAVNYRGFGPICPNTGLPGGVIAIDGRAGNQTAAYVRCYQEWANAAYAMGRPGYTQPISVDGWVGRETYLAMLRTCQNDSSYITGNMTSGASYGSYWFCVR